MTKLDDAIRAVAAAAETQQVRILRQRVSTLQRQRDQANARAAELRQHLARYQRELAEARGRANR